MSMIEGLGAYAIGMIAIVMAAIETLARRL